MLTRCIRANTFWDVASRLTRFGVLMAFEVNGDLSFAKLCIKQLSRALRGPCTMDKAESASICLGVVQRDIEAWVRLNADKSTSRYPKKS